MKKHINKILSWLVVVCMLFSSASVNVFAAELGMNGETIESGSSWLSVLSMTGIIGFLIIMRIYSKSVISAYKFGKDPLLISILTLLSVNMFTEGYIFFGGSFLAFLFWITIGVCSDKKYGLTR